MDDEQKQQARRGVRRGDKPKPRPRKRSASEASRLRGDRHGRPLGKARLVAPAVAARTASRNALDSARQAPCDIAVEARVIEQQAAPAAPHVREAPRRVRERARPRAARSRPQAPHPQAQDPRSTPASVCGVALAALAARGQASPTPPSLRELPDIPATPPAGRDQTSVIYDRNGEVLAKLFAEQNRTDRTLAEIPVALRQAVIATEDQRYYDHQGVDPLGHRTRTVGRRHPGQAPRRLDDHPAVREERVRRRRENTLKRKVKEAMLAYRLEKELLARTRFSSCT